jgi:zinc transport system substrate-binding protein
VRFPVLSLAVVLALGACGTSGEEPVAEPEPAEEAEEAEETEEVEAAVLPGEGLTAVATLFPLAWMAEQVAPGAEITFLGARGQDPHDLELSPADRTRLETADVVLYLGDLGFQPQVEAALTGRAGRTVDVRATVGEEALRDFDDDHGHDDDEHEEAEYDPHVWFDPAVMAQVATEIGAAFAGVDADNAGEYRERAQALHDDLIAVAEEFDMLLSDCRFDTAIVSHEAYAYLLEPRGLEQEGISGAGGHGEASPRRLAELTERIRAEGISAVLAEPFEGRADAEALAAEAGVEMLEIDPLEIVTEELYAIGYVELLREQARTFATALECG